MPAMMLPMNENTSDTRSTPVHAATKLAGGCHCGAVRWEAEVDLSAGTSKCNCTICSKTGYWGAMMKPSAFKLLSGEDNLTDYLFNSNSMHHLFCKTCGIHSFGRGDIPQLGGAFCSVNLNCVDDLQVSGLTVRHFDGRNNNWQSPRVEVLA